MNLAIIGATGLVGGMFLNLIKERNMKYDKLYLFASKKSAGKQIVFKNKTYCVLALNKKNIKHLEIDYALFSAGAKVSKKWAPFFASNKIVVIDNSSAFRKRKNVPLVVPEVNAEDLKFHKYIISNPNCSTIQAVVAINILKAYGLKRIIYSTYQSVSGAGQKGINDLYQKSDSLEKFDYAIKDNLIPYIDKFNKNGYTKEELKMIFETRKILHLPNLKITATAVRVPIPYCHGESINIELKKKFDIKDIKNLFSSSNVVLFDDIKNNFFPMPIFCKNTDSVFIGRIRRDYSVKNGLNVWVVADNLRKGAATNAIDILETLIKGEINEANSF